jgi:hypothetical protein
MKWILYLLLAFAVLYSNVISAHALTFDSIGIKKGFVLNRDPKYFMAGIDRLGNLYQFKLGRYRPYNLTCQPAPYSLTLNANLNLALFQGEANRIGLEFGMRYIRDLLRIGGSFSPVFTYSFKDGPILSIRPELNCILFRHIHLGTGIEPSIELNGGKSFTPLIFSAAYAGRF